MKFGTFEILAFLLIAVAAIKMIFLAVKPGAWMNFAKSIYKNTKILQGVFFVLAAVLLYFLLGAGLTILQVLAVMLFTSFVFAMALAPYTKPLFKAIKPNTVLKDNKLVVVAWIVLIVWGLKELFF